MPTLSRLTIFVAALCLTAVTLHGESPAAAGGLDDLWQASTPGTPPGAATSEAGAATSGGGGGGATIKAKPLRGPGAGRLASLNNSIAEMLLAQRRVAAMRKQDIAITSLDTSTGDNTTAFARIEQQALFTGRPAGYYDVYGVYRPYATAGYVVDESIVTSGANYFRQVSYVPTVIYPVPYAYRPCYPPRYNPCYGPRWNCGFPRGGGLTIRATGDWGFVGYRSNAWSGSSLKVRLQF